MVAPRKKNEIDNNFDILFFIWTRPYSLYLRCRVSKRSGGINRRVIRCISILSVCAARNRIQERRYFSTVRGHIYVFTTRVAFFQSSCLYCFYRKGVRLYMFLVICDSYDYFYPQIIFILILQFYHYHIFIRIIRHYHIIICRNYDKKISYLSVSFFCFWRI